MENAAPACHCFVLSGGIGSRLWPLSRADNPKQFHRLTSDNTLLEETVLRMHAQPGAQVTIISSANHRDVIRRSLNSISHNSDRCILEPCGRNTAAAVAFAAQDVLAREGDGLVLISPSDARIVDYEGFWQGVNAGADAAWNHDSIVVFGISPTRPETGYGYIKCAADSGIVLDVQRFVEKPDLERARAYLETGSYFWNAGIFLFRASVMRRHFETLQPDIWKATQRAFDSAKRHKDDIFPSQQDYGDIPSQSIDFAIMEIASPIKLVKTDYAWSDVGSWQGLWEISQKDDEGNVVRGDARQIQSRNTLITSTGPLVTAVGMEDTVIVATPDSIFVSSLNRSEVAGDMARALTNEKRVEASHTAASMAPTRSSIAQCEDWFRNDVLPYWEKNGIDNQAGGFHEILDFDGNSTGADKRLRTMARQTYCFAKASKLNWLADGVRLTDHGLDYLLAVANDNDAGFARTTDTEGNTVDPIQDLYDIACVLLAAAASLPLVQEKAETLGTLTLSLLRSSFRIKGAVGFCDQAGKMGGTSELPRRANPHMHLFEALLEWYLATKDVEVEGWLHELAELFHASFSPANEIGVVEFLDEDLNPIEGKQGKLREPGHSYEWAWLLHEYALVFDKSLHSKATQLYANAVAFGTNPFTELGYQEFYTNGMAPVEQTRSWIQTEAVRGTVVQMIAGALSNDEVLKSRLGSLFKFHIDAAPTGGWIDRIDGLGVAQSKSMPASILYHLTTMMLSLQSIERQA